MLLTDRFVFVHQPKTGGTFVTRMIKRALSPRPWVQKVHGLRSRHGISIPFFPYRYRELGKQRHAMCRMIPSQYARLPILACVRNPYDIYVSEYKFNWWRDNAEKWFVDVPAVEREFGPLAEFDFDRFARATLRYNRWCDTARNNGGGEHGYYSTEWSHFFSRDPQLVRASADNPELAGEAEKSLFQAHFIHMENLNDGLADFFATVGFAEEDVERVRTHKRVYPGKPTRAEKDPWQSYYTPELKQLVGHHERLLLRRFPQYQE